MSEILAPLTFILVGMTLLAYLLTGWWESRSVRTPLQFFLADRSLKPLGFVGTIISTNAAVANVFFLYVLYGYLFGIGALVWGFLFWCATFMAFWWLLKTRLRNEILHWDTLHEFLGASFNNSRAFRAIAALTTIACFIIALSSEVVVGSNVFQLFTAQKVSDPSTINLGIPLFLSIVVAIYISLGGFKATIRTDIFQAILITIALIPLAYWSLPYLWQSATSASLEDFTLLPGHLAFVAFTFMSWLAWSPVAMDMWQRCTASKQVEIPLKWIPLSLIFFLLYSIIPVSVGIAIRFIDPSTFQTMPALAFLEHLINSNSGDLLPVLGLAFILTGLAAGILSTIDTFLLVCSQSLVTDVFTPFRYNKRVSELDEQQSRRALLLGRFFIWIIPIIAIPVFLTAIRLGHNMVLIFNYVAYSCPLVLLPSVLASVFWKGRLKSTLSAIASTVISFSIVLYASFTFGFAVYEHPEIQANWNRVYAIPAVALSSSFLLYIITFLFSRWLPYRKETSK